MCTCRPLRAASPSLVHVHVDRMPLHLNTYRVHCGVHIRHDAKCHVAYLVHSVSAFAFMHLACLLATLSCQYSKPHPLLLWLHRTNQQCNACNIHMLPCQNARHALTCMCMTGGVFLNSVGTPEFCLLQPYLSYNNLQVAQCLTVRLVKHELACVGGTRQSSTVVTVTRETVYLMHACAEDAG